MYSSNFISISPVSPKLTPELLDVALPKTQASLPRLLSGSAGSRSPPRKDRNKQSPPPIEWWKQNTAAVKGQRGRLLVQSPPAFNHKKLRAMLICDIVSGMNEKSPRFKQVNYIWLWQTSFWDRCDWGYRQSATSLRSLASFYHRAFPLMNMCHERHHSRAGVSNV